MQKKLIFLSANVLQLALRFLQMIVVTRSLSGTELGTYYAAAAYPQLFARIFDLGLPHATRYFVLKQPGQVNSIITIAFIFSISVFPVIAVVFYSLQHLPLEAAEILSAISENWMILSLYCLLLTVNAILNAFLISLEKFKVLLLSLTLPYIVFIAIILYKVLSSDLSVRDVLIQLLISELIILLIYAGSLYKSRKDKQEGVPSLQWKMFMQYGLKIYPNGLLKTMTVRLDRVILSFIAPTNFIGYYSVLMTLRDIAIVPVSTYGQLFMNHVAKVIQQGKETLQDLVHKNMWIILAGYTLGFLTFILFQDFILKLFFKHVSEGMYRASFFLILSVIPLALTSILSNVLMVMNRPSIVSWSSVISIIVFYLTILLLYERISSQSFYYAAIISAAAGLCFTYGIFRGKRIHSNGKYEM